MEVIWTEFARAGLAKHVPVLPPPGALEACARLGEGLRNVLIFNSLSKRSNAGGLRCGFVAGDERIIEAFRRLRSFSGGQVPIPIQLAGAALWDDDEHVEINRRHYRRNFEIAEALLGDAFEFRRPAASLLLIWPLRLAL